MALGREGAGAWSGVCGGCGWGGCGAGERKEKERAGEEDDGAPVAQVKEVDGASVLGVQRGVGAEVGGDVGGPAAEGAEAAGYAADGEAAAYLGGGEEAVVADALAELDELDEEGLVAEGGVWAGVEDLWEGMLETGKDGGGLVVGGLPARWLGVCA